MFNLNVNLTQAIEDLTKTINKYGFNASTAAQHLKDFHNALKKPVPSFVCGTINKESLIFYDYNIDEFLYNGLQRDKNE